MMIITIDGPAGTGKTSIARAVAKRLGLRYFDTGAMYRTVAYLLLHERIPLSNQKKIAELLTHFDFEIRIEKDDVRYLANGMDVTELIRTQAVTNIVSPVSALPVVREALWKIQRRFAKKMGGVFEGRDMGSVVFPKSKIKIFLTARVEIRAQRRLGELREKSPEEIPYINHQQMIEQLLKRDEMDSARAIAPLTCPPDAYTIDTSYLSFEEVVNAIVEYKTKKVLRPIWSHRSSINWTYRLTLFFSWCIGKLFFRLKVYGLEHYYPKGAILAPNHTSFLDPPIVSVSWPEEVHFLARESLFSDKLFATFIRKLNTHPIRNRGNDIAMMKKISALLSQGKKVILFPEGTRSQDGKMQPLKPGVALLVSSSKSAVIPVYIDGAYQALGRGKKFPILFRKIVCIFGTPICWTSFAHLDKKEGVKQLLHTLSKAYVNLKKWYEAGAQGIPP